ncbi:MAG: Xaa-Pro peptidase family protein, partial [Planctomycetota bacterium]
SLLHVPRDPAEGFRQHKDTAAAYRRNVSADPLVGDHLSLPQHLHAKLAAMLPRATLADVSHVLHDLRLTKSDAELRLLREAGRLCGVAVQEAMRATKPGVREHQLAAVADYVFRAAGALGGAHKPIIAAGYANIYAMHYWRLESPLQSGDLVLMDYASDLRYYTSDIGRMWPVDGTYAAEHRALLGLCIEYHKLLLAEIRPGRTTDDIYAATRPTLQALVDGWDFADPDAEVAARALIDSKRPLSHPVGMAIHDPGNHRTRELKVGDVFAVDPELFDKKRRRYIRCEDTVVVTETGCEVLTPCPLELDDIEAHMAGGTGGMLDAFPVERMGR